MRRAITAVATRARASAAASAIADAVPRALLQPRRLGLRARHARVRGLLQPLQSVSMGSISCAPAGSTHGAPARSQPARARRRRRRGSARTPPRGRPGAPPPASVCTRSPQAGEVGAARVGGALPPEIRVALVAQDDEACLQARHGQQRVAHAGGEAQRGQRLAGDLPVHGDQAADGAQAQDADRGQHHDDQREAEEDLRRQPHAVRLPSGTRTVGRQRSPPGVPAPDHSGSPGDSCRVSGRRGPPDGPRRWRRFPPGAPAPSRRPAR